MAVAPRRRQTLNCAASDEGGARQLSSRHSPCSRPSSGCRASPICAGRGRHEEADKSLAEFRKRYPDYRISKEVLEQLEKR